MAKAKAKASEVTEEAQPKDFNDGTLSGLKKTIIGTLTTAIGGAGIWLSTFLGGGAKTESKDKDQKDGKAKTEQVAPAPAPVVINLSNNNTNQQKQSGGNTTIIKEKTIVEKAAPAEKKAEKKSETENAPW